MTQKHKTLKGASILTTLLMLLALLAVLPATPVRAAGGSIDVSDASGVGKGTSWSYDATDHVITITEAGSYDITGSSIGVHNVTTHTLANVIKVDAAGKNVTLNLNGVEIAVKYGTPETASAIDIAAGNVTLVLGENTTNSFSDNRGNNRSAVIHVAGTPAAASLTIRGKGALSAINSNTAWSAAIGGRMPLVSSGNYWNHPGLTHGPITIEGGTVTAISCLGAAIGSGAGSPGGAGGTITIKGGTVNATTSDNGAAIGGGGCISVGQIKTGGGGGTVIIEGGTVNATSAYGAAIGCGAGAQADTSYPISESGGNITIKGANTIVNAKSGRDIAGGICIGGAADAAGGTLSVSNGATVNIEKALADTSFIGFPAGNCTYDKTSFVFAGLTGEKATLIAGKPYTANLELKGSTAKATASFDGGAAQTIAAGGSVHIPFSAKAMVLSLSLSEYQSITSASATNNCTAVVKDNTVIVTAPNKAAFNTNFSLTVTLKDSTPAKEDKDTGDDTSRPEPVVASGLSLNMGAKVLRAGQKVALKATVTPANAEDKTVTWTTSNEKVATVSAQGLVRAKKNGKATITAKAGNKTVSCKIIVRADAARKAVKSVKLDKRNTTLKPGKTLRLMATLAPKTALNKKVIWESSNPDIATVTAKGVVKAKAKGKVKITAISYEGGKMAVCTITVK